MNTQSSVARRDGVAACIITIAVAAFLFTWSPSLRPGFAPPRLPPPTITYCPATMMDGDYQGECPDPRLRCDRDPSLIALSAAMMLPPAKRSQSDVITPPLDTAYSFLRFPAPPPTERYDQMPMLTPLRPMPPLAPQRLAIPVPTPARGVAETRQQSPTPPSYRVELIGDWQGRSVDLSSMSALNEPAGPWSFTATLRYDQAGQVQHALLESASLNQSLRDEVARRLYQCRVTSGGTSGEGRLTVSGPGRPLKVK